MKATKDIPPLFEAVKWKQNSEIKTRGECESVLSSCLFDST